MQEELERLRRRVREARKEQRALMTEVTTLRAGLAGVRQDLERIDRSWSWRWGHAVAVTARRLTGRAPLTSGAVQAALERLDQLERAIGAAPFSLPAPAGALPPGHAERVPQQADPVWLAAEIRSRLGAPRPLAEPPLVSIVVVTRDGRELVARLVDSLIQRTDYPRFELIVVDNGSTDGTLEWLDGIDPPFPLVVEANPDNRPFGEACNAGAAAGRGELLLFLNNDVEPTDAAWLHEMVATADGDAAAVGARLLHAAVTHPAAPSGWIVQHRGIRFVRDGPRAARPQRRRR